MATLPEVVVGVAILVVCIVSAPVNIDCSCCLRFCAEKEEVIEDRQSPLSSSLVP